MKEKFISLSLLVFFLLIFWQILRYTYLAWFRSDNLIKKMSEDRPSWQKGLRPFLNLKESYQGLIIIRVSTLFIFLISLPMLFLLLWLIKITWIG